MRNSLGDEKAPSTELVLSIPANHFGGDYIGYSRRKFAHRNLQSLTTEPGQDAALTNH